MTQSLITSNILFALEIEQNNKMLFSYVEIIELSKFFTAVSHRPNLKAYALTSITFCQVPVRSVQFNCYSIEVFILLWLFKIPINVNALNFQYKTSLIDVLRCSWVKFPSSKEVSIDGKKSLLLVFTYLESISLQTRTKLQMSIKWNRKSQILFAPNTLFPKFWHLILLINFSGDYEINHIKENRLDTLL